MELEEFRQTVAAQQKEIADVNKRLTQQDAGTGRSDGAICTMNK
jgi:hypothetical protein